ncbi:MAG: ABC transporter ATP-binding protein [Lachnospirales bacterium]
MNNNIVYKLIMKNKKHYIIAFTSVIIATSLMLVPPIITAYVVDGILQSSVGGEAYEAPYLMAKFVELMGNPTSIWFYSITIAIVGILVAILTYFRGKSSAIASENLVNDLRNIIYEKLMKTDYAYYGTMKSGEIIQRCTSDINLIRLFWGAQIVDMVRIIGSVVPALILLFTINVKLSLYAVCILPFIFLVSYFTKGILDKKHQEFEEREAEFTSGIQEVVNGVRVIKAFNNQQLEIDKFTNLNNNLYKTLKNLLNGYALFWSASDFFCLLQFAVVVITCAIAASRGEISVGDYLIFVSCSMRYVFPLRQLSRMVGEYSKTVVAINRVNELLDIEEEKDLETGTISKITGDIEVENLSFAFPDDKDTLVLKDVSFSIKNGENIGFLGSTGSGKSTLMHLLIRLYDYEEGSIKINGVELKEMNKKNLRENVSIVLQDSFLFTKTIFENIKLANPVSNNNKVEYVTDIASVHRTIKKFEKGYETLVGEKGVTLSGGQKQRVAIARTLIKDSKLIIFDDSLSAVDVDTDNRIRQRLREHNQDLTTIIIAQRINTLMECDKIIVMDKGEITHIGTHDELIKIEDSLYKKIWDIQNLKSDEAYN